MIELEESNLCGKSQAPVVDRKSLAKHKHAKHENDDHVEGKNPTKLTTQSDEELCRICWGTDGEDENGEKLQEGDINPLISPCKCNGTMGQIHLKCLRGWLSTKRTRKEHKK
jgi:hypothetical protein